MIDEVESHPFSRIISQHKEKSLLTPATTPRLNAERLQRRLFALVVLIALSLVVGKVSRLYQYQALT